MDSRDPWDENHHQTHHHLRENIFGSLFQASYMQIPRGRLRHFQLKKFARIFCHVLAFSKVSSQKISCRAFF